MNKTHQIEIRVRFEETDLLGIVWHGNYLRYFEAGRIEWVRNILGEIRLKNPDSYQFVVKSLQIEYEAPAHFDDLLTVTTSLTRATRLNLLFEQKIHRADVLLVAAQIVGVCINAEGKFQSVPQFFRDM